MQTYLLSAVSVIFLSVIVALLIPEGKLNKTITFVLRIICIIVLMQPITKIFIVPEQETDYEIIDYNFVSEEYSRHQSEQLAELIKSKFSVEAECDVDIDYSDGNFSADKVAVRLSENNRDLIDEIYEYLSGLGYINISVYAEST